MAMIAALTLSINFYSIDIQAQNTKSKASKRNASDEQSTITPKTNAIIKPLNSKLTQENFVLQNDPFKPFFKEYNTRQAPRKKQTGVMKYELSQLRLVGILISPSGNMAVVEDSLGQGYILVKGSLVGLKSGKVIDIQHDRVLIEERHKDIYDQVILLQEELRLIK